MNHLSLLKNFSTKNKTWCYRQGFYQTPNKYKINQNKINKINENKINENKGISYHQWLAGLRDFATTETGKTIRGEDGWGGSTINME